MTTAKPKPRKTTAKPRRAARTDRARETFLATLRDTCNVSESARSAGIGRRTAYEWRDADPAFAVEWDDAEQEAIDKLEQVARDRAIDTSDRMLEILLKAHRPEKYVDRYRTEHTGKDGGPIEYRNLGEDEIDARLAALAESNGLQRLAP